MLFRLFVTHTFHILWFSVSALPQDSEQYMQTTGRLYHLPFSPFVSSLQPGAIPGWPWGPQDLKLENLLQSKLRTGTVMHQVQLLLAMAAFLTSRAGVLAVLLLIQVPANASGKSVGDGPSPSSSASTCQVRWSFSLLVLTWYHYVIDKLGNEQMDRRSLCVYSSNL